MNAYAHNTYVKTGQSALSPREAEARALRKSNMLLENALKTMNENDINEAANFSDKLWSIIQSELIKNQSDKPNAFVANIISISIFIDKVMSEIRSGNMENLETVIFVNKQIISGLEGKPE